MVVGTCSSSARADCDSNNFNQYIVIHGPRVGWQTVAEPQKFKSLPLRVDSRYCRLLPGGGGGVLSTHAPTSTAALRAAPSTDLLCPPAVSCVYLARSSRLQGGAECDLLAGPPGPARRRASEPHRTPTPASCTARPTPNYRTSKRRPPFLLPAQSRPTPPKGCWSSDPCLAWSTS